MSEKPKILIVDDDYASLSSTKMILEGVYEVTATESPRDALKQLERQEFQLILLDIFIPEMNGMEVLKTVRSKHSHIPVIILSGSVEWVRRKGEVEKLGASDYILKPFDAIALQNRVKEALTKNNL